jgi:hypothetical protein
VSRADTLKELEQVLESFLDRVVHMKEDRILVLGSINRLDDIARGVKTGEELTDDVGNWFAEHNAWLKEDLLRTADRNRIGEILGSIKKELGPVTDSTPEIEKIYSEIERWTSTMRPGGPALTLKRGPEVGPTTPSPAADRLQAFGALLDRLRDMYADLSGNREHIMSVLDDSLKKADLQRDKEALILSATIIYYLKQNGYKVEPYVKRLKEAERVQERNH